VRNQNNNVWYLSFAIVPQGSLVRGIKINNQFSIYLSFDHLFSIVLVQKLGNLSVSLLNAPAQSFLV
jgi:hypothetical protein